MHGGAAIQQKWVEEKQKRKEIDERVPVTSLKGLLKAA
jgi:hypothetical protein